MMKFKPPKIIGHRGVAGYAPENTLESIETAADMGIDWVELDVKLTKDEIPVIFHDDTLERTTNGSGPIAEITYEDLQHLEAGSWFADTYAGIKIPTLEEALDILITHDMGLNLEIKPCPGREKETAEVALDVLSGIWDDHERLLISSFSHVSMEVAHDMAQDWRRALLLPEEWPENWRDMAEYLGVSCVNINGNTVERFQVEQIVDELGLPILAYTINDADRARILQSWGVDGFFSDSPDLLQDGLLTVH